MKELPFVFPPIETYQSSSFVLGVLLAYKRTENAALNMYTNISAKSEILTWNLDFQFDNSMWSDFVRCGVELNLFNARNQERQKFCSFLEERIDQDCYLLFYAEDDFFLSHTINYQRRHFVHDIYVYGYTADDFLVVGYKDNKLQQFALPKKEIVDAFYELEDDSVRNFCTMRVSECAKIELDYNEMMNDIKLYFSESVFYTDGRIHGTAVNSLLLKSLCYLRDGNDRKTMDLRPFRLIWEHKKLMSTRIKILAEKYSIKNVVLKIENIEILSQKVFMLSIKYNMLFSKSILNKMISLVEEIIITEKELSSFFKDDKKI